MRLVTIGAASLIAWLSYEAVTWPDVDALAGARPRTTAFIEEARERGPVDWRWVPYESISVDLKHAVLVAEDVAFFFHQGFDSDEIEASLRESIQTLKPPRGASTITQQVAKNLWLSPSRNPIRKLKEAVFTSQLEANLSKRRILEIYLNVAELGKGIYGAEAAAERYLGRSAGTLSRRESAELAALLSRPRTWRFRDESRAYRHRVDVILQRMERTTWLLRHISGLKGR